MTDADRKAQEERAQRLRQEIKEIAEPTPTGAEQAPRTPRDFVNPARPGTAADKGPGNS